MVEPTDPRELARWSSDDERRAYRSDRELLIPKQLTARRRAAEEFKPSPFEIPRDVGFVFYEGNRFPDVPAVVSSARDVLAGTDLDQLMAGANKRFMMKLLDPDLVTLESPFMRLALRPDIIATVSRYLGMVPILQFASVYFSSVSGEGFSKSQLYHCDSDDLEQVKVWVLCDEVTPETGPLTLLPAAESDLVRKTTGYRYDMALTDDQVSAVLGSHNAARQFLGPPGTVGFIDTSRCLHFGSRFTNPAMTRLIVMLQYVTPLAFILPPKYRKGARYGDLGAAPELDEVSRMVLGTW
jgi:hypothetical protein